MSTPAFQLATSVPGKLGLSGALTFATAADALMAMTAAVRAASSPVSIDLAGVTRSDSAGLACVLAVLSDAETASRTLTVVNLPAGMRTLAQVCEVDSLLG